MQIPSRSGKSPPCGVQVRHAARVFFSQACTRLAPALDIDLYVRIFGDARQRIVKANDWLTLPPLELLQRIHPVSYENGDPTKFGHWMQLSDLLDNSGKVVGRCAIQPYRYLPPFAGAGVVKGLLAGAVPGLTGIVFTKPQDDLARKTAIPDVSLREVQRWAEEQKKILLSRGQIGDGDSALLARFGADHASLTLGQLCRQSISYEEFVKAARTSALILVHDGEVSHDDDDVLRKDFDSDFEADKFLLETTSQAIPAWLGQIDDGSVSRDSWSLEAALESALKEAWGDVDWGEDKETVGSVNGTDIDRRCKIASQNIDIDDHYCPEISGVV